MRCYAIVYVLWCWCCSNCYSCCFCLRFCCHFDCVGAGTAAAPVMLELVLLVFLFSSLSHFMLMLKINDLNSFSTLHLSWIFFYFFFLLQTVLDFFYFFWFSRRKIWRWTMGLFCALLRFTDVFYPLTSCILTIGSVFCAARRGN